MRKLIIWGRDDERGVCEKTVHDDRERFQVVFSAIKAGADFVEIYDY